jgi:hypothetical protein
MLFRKDTEGPITVTMLANMQTVWEHLNVKSSNPAVSIHAFASVFLCSVVLCGYKSWNGSIIKLKNFYRMHKGRSLSEVILNRIREKP